MAEERFDVRVVVVGRDTDDQVLLTSEERDSLFKRRPDIHFESRKWRGMTQRPGTLYVVDEGNFTIWKPDTD